MEFQEYIKELHSSNIHNGFDRYFSSPAQQQKVSPTENPVSRLGSKQSKSGLFYNYFNNFLKIQYPD